MPTSCAMVLASSSARAFRPSEIFCRQSARVAAGVLAQPSNAARAARTAASTSFSPAAGMRPMTSPLPALCTSIDAPPDEGASHWPPMNSLSFSNMGCLREGPIFYPAILAREVTQGDHVIFAFIYMCGKCRFCASGRPVLCLEQGKALTTPLEGTPRVRDAKGEPLNIFSGCGAMAEYATVSAENLIKVDPEIPFECAALVGCGVTTGVGAVFNTAKVQPGSSVAVFVCGGVGRSGLQSHPT